MAFAAAALRARRWLTWRGLQTTAHVDERSSPIELLRWTLQYSAKYLDLILYSKATRVLFDGA